MLAMSLFSAPLSSKCKTEIIVVLKRNTTGYLNKSRETAQAKEQLVALENRWVENGEERDEMREIKFRKVG